MKLIAQVKLKVTPEQADALKRTMRGVNAACNYISQYAWENKTFGRYALQKAIYYQVREEFGLSAQATVRAIAKVADTYKVDRKRQHKFNQRIANRRRDFQHKLSRRLVNEFGLIFREGLNVSGLCRSHVSKGMSDAAWAQFFAMLDYKAESAGSRVIEVDACGSSQICPMCGCVVPKSLSDRLHICPHCGYVAPRDVAAACVILIRGRARTGPPRKGFPRGTSLVTPESIRSRSREAICFS